MTNKLPATQREINQWNFFIHLSQLSGVVFPLCSIIVPLILWQMKKNDWPTVNAHGKEVINWQLSLLLYAIISYILVFILVGFLMLFVLGIAFIVCAIIGSIKAQEGTLWKYPFAIRFLK